MASTGNWEEKTLKKIADEQRLTALGTNRELELADQPNFQVYEFSPNKRLDRKDRYYIAGPDYSVMIQSSVLKAAHDMLGNRLGFLVTFEEWFEQWQEGFTFAINRTGTTGMVTNYPIRTVGERPGWRTDRDSLPAYLEWKNPNAKANPSYRVIEYWPDKSIKTKSYVLTGSDAQIIHHILQIEYEGGTGVAAQAVNEPKFTGSTSFKGLPKVKLYFIESSETVDAAYFPIEARLSFRIVGKTERHDLVNSGRTDLDKLTTADVKAIANRIIEQFAKPTPYRIHKGKATIKYLNKRQGIESWTHVMSKADGTELYTKLCAVAGVTFNRSRLSYTELDDPLTEFPTIPPKMSILGQEFKGIRNRPSGHVYFSHSTLSLESLRYEINLTTGKAVVFEESKLQETQSGSGIQF